MGIVKFLKSKLRRKPTAGDQESATPAGSNGRLKPHHPGPGLLLKLSWNEIETLTRHFSIPIGCGGFSNVYLAEFQGGPTSLAAVKVLHGCSQRLFQAYRQELEILLRLHRHPYIVNLFGYSDNQESAAALIFEYVSNGTLHDKLHGRPATATATTGEHLRWRSRVSIAFQLAQAVAYLHDGCSPHIVHGDIKPSNILLDDGLNCKLCDFGSAKMGFSSSVVPNSRRARVVGSPGYTDPSYLKTGIASKKNDVYSFGAVLVELITGMEAIGAKGGGEVEEMVDPTIRGDAEPAEVKAVAALARMCLSECPNNRPSAKEIVATLTSIVPFVAFSGTGKKCR